jgi:GNAT superfamily N-acetyltransferase
LVQDERSPDITISSATPADAAGIAAVHVSVWRNAYAGLLPDYALETLSAKRLSHHYLATILAGPGAFVARDTETGTVIGFTTASVAPLDAPAAGEVKTLYVADDWREQGLGRALLREAASFLTDQGCGSMFLWVLADNPSRWFYERMGGRPVRQDMTRVGGVPLPIVAMQWNNVGNLPSM